MENTTTVDANTRKKVVSARYRVDRVKLLEAIQARRGDPTLSDTVVHALNRLVEVEFPGATQETP